MVYTSAWTSQRDIIQLGESPVEMCISKRRMMVQLVGLTFNCCSSVQGLKIMEMEVRART